jgi:Lon-like protease
MHERALMIVLFLAVLVFTVHPSAHAEYIELPILAAIGQNNLGVLEIMLLGWDKKSDPNPVQLLVNIAGVRYGMTHLGSMAEAFDYAVQHTAGLPHTGTVSVQGISYRPTGSDGPSAGAVMAVGFIATFKGERIQRGTALTGTLEPGGRIGWVVKEVDTVEEAYLLMTGRSL